MSVRGSRSSRLHAGGGAARGRSHRRRYSRNGTLWNIGPVAVSLRLDASGLDHFGPPLGIVGDELAEVGGRAGEYFTTEFGHPRLHRRIGDGRVDLPVEPFDDPGGGALGNANAKPAGDRVARDNIADQRE